jgi:hypothetical protein
MVMADPPPVEALTVIFTGLDVLAPPRLSVAVAVNE